MDALNLLIVEDEVLIADTIERYLVQQGHQIVGKAISVEEGKKIFAGNECDIALIDIRLSGKLSGIDFAHFINEQEKSIPFIFLTSQTDPESVNEAKNTFPAGYLSKPLQKESLCAMIEIAMHASQIPASRPSQIRLSDGVNNHVIYIDDILYLQADHIYVKVYLANGEVILQRTSLNDLSNKLPPEQFIQSHRSYIINTRHITRWNINSLFIGEHKIPISRSRRKIITQQLNNA